jgi:uncharacterized protein with FMN-binding domain
MAQGGSHKKVANSLVALSCAAVMGVYTAGYVRTRAAASQFEERTTEHRGVVEAPVQGGPAGEEVQVTERRPVEAAAVRPVARSASSEETAEPNVIVGLEPPTVAAVVSSGAGIEAITPALATPTAAPPPPPPATPPPPSVPAPVAPAAPAVEQAAAAVPAPPPSPKWKDGRYTGWGRSRHGNIQAEVVIEEGRILGATIIQCLTRYSCSVIDMLPPQVAQRQSAEVDFVSRATESADAFYYAVVEALSKAK